MGNTVRTQLSEAPSVPGWIAVDASWQGTMNCPLLSTAAGALATGCHPTAAPPWFHRVWPTSWSASARAFFQWSRAQAEADFFWGCKLQTQRQSPSTSNHLVWAGKHSCKFSKIIFPWKSVPDGCSFDFADKLPEPNATHGIPPARPEMCEKGMFLCVDTYFVKFIADDPGFTKWCSTHWGV